MPVSSSITRRWRRRPEPTKKYPSSTSSRMQDGNDIMQQQIDRNYSRIKADVLQIIEDEMEGIANDPGSETPDSTGGRKKRGIGHRCFISACKVRPVPYGLCKAGPFGFREKSSSLRLRYFSRKPCAIRARNGGAGKKSKSRLAKPGMSNSKNKRYEQKQLYTDGTVQRDNRPIRTETDGGGNQPPENIRLTTGSCSTTIRYG